MGLQGLLQEEAIHETKAVSWGDLPPTGRRESGGRGEREGRTNRETETPRGRKAPQNGPARPWRWAAQRPLDILKRVFFFVLTVL